MESKEDIIAKDKEEHPECFYGESSSMRCSNNDDGGDFICKTIRNIQRMCPRKRPVTIYSSTEQTRPDQTESGFHTFDPFAGFQIPGDGSGGGFGAMDNDLFAVFGRMLGGGHPEDFQRFPHPSSQYRQRPSPKIRQPPELPGEARGPIERI